MTNPLIQKLEVFGLLPDEDKRLLEQVVQRPRIVSAHTNIIMEGDAPGDVRLILKGFACRYKMLAGGSRHIMAYLLPGDFCDLHIVILNAMDHCISTLSACSVVEIPRNRVLELIERPSIARALWWAGLVDEATLREWLVNIGGRSAERRVAHLFCEILMRLRFVGLVKDDSYEFPLTQTDVADTIGISAVHMNRVLQGLRQEKLVSLRSKRVMIKDVERLMQFSGFNPNYLHLRETTMPLGCNQ